MGVDAAQTVALATVLPAIVGKANSTQEALESLAAALRPAIPSLWRASVRKFLPVEEQLEVVAVWSAVKTRIEPGLRMSALASSFPEVSRLDRPILSSERLGERPLVEQVIASEGVASWVSIPLHQEGHVVGLLSLSSLEAHAFEPSDVAFFERVGAGVERKLID